MIPMKYLKVSPAGEVTYGTTLLIEKYSQGNLLSDYSCDFIAFFNTNLFRFTVMIRIFEFTIACLISSFLLFCWIFIIARLNVSAIEIVSFSDPVKKALLPDFFRSIEHIV